MDTKDKSESLGKCWQQEDLHVQGEYDEIFSIIGQTLYEGSVYGGFPSMLN